MTKILFYFCSCLAACCSRPWLCRGMRVARDLAVLSGWKTRCRSASSCMDCLIEAARLRIERTDLVLFILSTLNDQYYNQNPKLRDHSEGFIGKVSSYIVRVKRKQAFFSSQPFLSLLSLRTLIFKNNPSITMEKTNLNVIIFEDDDPPAKEQRDPRSTNSSKSPSSHPQYDIIEQEIHYLSEKVKSLQQQSDGLSLFRNDSNCTQKNSATAIEAAPSRDLLVAIERKIQIVIRETRKIVEKLGESFEKKLEGRVSKKYDELGVGKMKEGYAASLRKIEEHYRREIEKASQEFKEAEARMAARAGEVEQLFLSRMNDFEMKEKEYVAWIHHLELQLKEKGSKKMIELTQEKATRKDVSEGSILSNNLENNYSSINQNHNPNLRVSPLPNDQNSSKLQRKHRIFDNKGSSVSPNNKLPNPTNPPSLPPAMQSSKLVNPAIRTRPFADSEPDQPVTLSLATRTTDPIKNLFASENESSPWRMIDKDSGKRTGEASNRHKVIENVREEEFYKDVPKPNSGWEKFQDFKEVDDDESSDSDEDVLFYREGDQNEEFLDHFRSTKMRGEDSNDPRRTGQESKKERFTSDAEQKVFSPFDLS